MFISPGNTYTLPIVRIERNSAYVDAFGRAIPIPLGDLSVNDKVGDDIDVFVYTDRDREWRATRKQPLLQVGEIAYLRVKDVANGIGFVDIGLGDDIPIFEDQQLEPLHFNVKYYMTLLFDEVEERLLGSTKIYRLAEDNPPYEKGDKVKFFIIEKADRGKKVMVDNKYVAFLHDRDMLPGTRRGEVYTGYIRDNHGRDFKVTMFNSGREKVDEAAERIMEMLHQHRGYLRLTDQTPSEEITLRLRMSKNTFKQALGKLYKERKVILTPRGIKLNRAD